MNIIIIIARSLWPHTEIQMLFCLDVFSFGFSPFALSIEHLHHFKCYSLCCQIRAKEALKAEAAMLRDPKTENEIAMLERLPGLIKILRSYPFL